MRLRATSALLVFLLVTFPGHARAASPESVTLNPSSPPTSFASALIGGFANDGTICIENVSCDTMVIVVAAGDYTGKDLKVSANWLVPANDFDIYAFLNGRGGTPVASSHGPPPGTHEEFVISLNGVLATPRTYCLNMVTSAGTPEMMQGTLTLVAPPAARTATTAGFSATWSPNTTMYAPGASRDCEPSVRVDTKGNCYVGGTPRSPMKTRWAARTAAATSTSRPASRAPRPRRHG